MRPLVSIALITLSSPAAATLLFEGDFETGDISQWSKAQIVADDRIQIVSSPLRQGSYAARFEVRQGDDPINASGNRAELVWTDNPEQEGDERWYSWSTLWPDDYPSEKTWQLFAQWHHSGCCGSPPLEFYVNGETLELRVNASDVIWTQPLSRGSWHDFMLHAKWSSDPNVGFVELWYDGAQVLSKTYGQNLYAGEVNYMKMGLYRNESIVPTGVIFHDGMRVGTTRADVEPPPVEPDAGAPDAASTDDAAQSGGSAGTGDSGSGGFSAGRGGGASGGSAAGSSGSSGLGSSGDDSGCSLSARETAPRTGLALLVALAALSRRRRA